MLSEKRLNDEDVEKKYDLTWLLAFFNNNRTVLHSIVPRVFFYEGAVSAHILVSLLHFHLAKREQLLTRGQAHSVLKPLFTTSRTQATLTFLVK